MQRVSAFDESAAKTLGRFLLPRGALWCTWIIRNWRIRIFPVLAPRLSLLTVNRDGNAAMTDRVQPAHADSPSPVAPESVPVLLLDDNLAVLEALKEAVAADETLTVVGAVCRISDAIRVAATTHPRVAVIDVNMPDGGGWTAARGLRVICPDIRLVAYSGFGDGLVVRTIAAAGVSAFVTKDSDIEVLLAAIHGRDVKPSPREPTPLLGRTDAVPT